MGIQKMSEQKMPILEILKKKTNFKSLSHFLTFVTLFFNNLSTHLSTTLAWPLFCQDVPAQQKNIVINAETENIE